MVCITNCVILLGFEGYVTTLLKTKYSLWDVFCILCQTIKMPNIVVPEKPLNTALSTRDIYQSGVVKGCSTNCTGCLKWWGQSMEPA